MQNCVNVSVSFELNGAERSLNSPERARMLYASLLMGTLPLLIQILNMIGGFGKNCFSRSQKLQLNPCVLSHVAGNGPVTQRASHMHITCTSMIFVSHRYM